MRLAVVFGLCILFAGCDDELYGDGSPWLPVEERDVPLLLNDPLRLHPYLRRMPRNDDEWAKFIQTLNAQNISLNAKTFTPTWTGFSSNPTSVPEYVNLGTHALISWSSGSLGTSNATSWGFSGLPTEIQPAAAENAVFPVVAVHNGNWVAARIVISGAVVTTYISQVVGTEVRYTQTGWTSGVSNGPGAGAVWFYPLF